MPLHTTQPYGCHIQTISFLCEVDFTSLYDLVEGKTKNLPLSVGEDEIRPVFGTSVMDLINPQ